MEHLAIFVNNPITTEICELSSTKKSEFYVHTYDPTNILKNIKEYNDPLLDPSIKIKYLENLYEKFDLTIKRNCCNCISFILYYVIDEKKLLDYLFSLKTSVENMSKYLREPEYNFIARIYLDQSVINLYKTEQSIKERLIINLYREIKEIIAFLFAHERVEIYTYNCKSYEDNKQITRSLRFLTLFDAEVNIKIIREADGFVSYLDCMNIKNFCLSNTILFMYKLNAMDLNYILDKKDTSINRYIEELNLNYVKSYSSWLNKYLDIINFDNDVPIKPLLDLYAGLLAVSLQFKPNYLNFNITKININLNKKYKISERNKQILDLHLIHLKDDKFKELLDNDFEKFYINFLSVCNNYNTIYKAYLDIKLINEEVKQKLRDIKSSLIKFKKLIQRGMIMNIEPTRFPYQSKIFKDYFWNILEKAFYKIIEHFDNAINTLLEGKYYFAWNIFINYFYINLINNYRYCFFINLLYAAIEDKLYDFNPFHTEIINYDEYENENNYILFYILPNISDFINLIFEYFNIFSDVPKKIEDFRSEISNSVYKNKYLKNLNKFIFQFNISENTEKNTKINLHFNICNYINKLTRNYYLLQKEMKELIFGFDEILLLELFNNITSFEKNIKNNLNTYKFYLNSFMTNETKTFRYKRDFTFEEEFKEEKDHNIRIEIETNAKVLDEILFPILIEKYLHSVSSVNKNIIIYDYENYDFRLYTSSVNLLNIFINKLDRYFIDIIFNNKEIEFNEFIENLKNKYAIIISEESFKPPFYGLFSLIEPSRESSFKKKYLKYKKKYLSLTL